MLLQELGSQAAAHPLRGTAAEWVGLLPLIPLAGFVYDLERLTAQTHPVCEMWDPDDPKGE